MAGSGSNPFGFIDILKGLPVVSKIIMCIGLFLFFIGVVSGPFTFFHNPKIYWGVALMFSSLSWRNFERVICHDPSPPYKMFLDFSSVFWALAFGAIALEILRICWLAPATR